MWSKSVLTAIFVPGFVTRSCSSDATWSNSLVLRIRRASVFRTDWSLPNWQRKADQRRSYDWPAVKWPATQWATARRGLTDGTTDDAAYLSEIVAEQQNGWKQFACYACVFRSESRWIPRFRRDRMDWTKSEPSGLSGSSGISCCRRDDAHHRTSVNVCRAAGKPVSSE